MKSADLKLEITKLQDLLKEALHKEKKGKGVLNKGEFCLLTQQDFDEDTGKVSGEEYYTVFFGSFEGYPIALTESYLDWETSYFKDLIDQAQCWERYKVKKISKEEAFKYL